MTVGHVPEWSYAHTHAPWWHSYLTPCVMSLVGGVRPGMRVLDVGCGNGFLLSQFAEQGCIVVGVDPSESGIEMGRRLLPSARFEIDVATPDLAQRLGEEPFDIVLSCEVIEHVYDSDSWAKSCFNALRVGGRLVLSTPYHGYLKNIAISASGKWDHHHTSLDTGSHIKFFSRRTMTTLLERNGFRVLGFRGCGRAPYLWKSMVMSAERPPAMG